MKNKFKEIFEYAKKNPVWFLKLKKKLDHGIEMKRMGKGDKKLDIEIKKVKSRNRDLDWAGKYGEPIEKIILKYAIKNAIPSFTGAFKSYFREVCR